MIRGPQSLDSRTVLQPVCDESSVDLLCAVHLLSNQQGHHRTLLVRDPSEGGLGRGSVTSLKFSDLVVVVMGRIEIVTMKLFMCRIMVIIPEMFHC